MIIPVRCFTCGAPVSENFDAYQNRIAAGENPEQVLNDLNVMRYCCRRMLLSQIDLVSEIARYKRA
ncbi:MAG: DNA-directed RNA polymerase subunit N [Methanopyri archaeon]|nr:DNA-directed RNA polymerase subunit N [Methanopyri archaeon]